MKKNSLSAKIQLRFKDIKNSTQQEKFKLSPIVTEMSSFNIVKHLINITISSWEERLNIVKSYNIPEHYVFINKCIKNIYSNNAIYKLPMGIKSCYLCLFNSSCILCPICMKTKHSCCYSKHSCCYSTPYTNLFNKTKSYRNSIEDVIPYIEDEVNFLKDLIPYWKNNGRELLKKEI